MVDTKQAKKGSQPGTGEKPQGRRTNRRNYWHEHEKKKVPESIPILRYGPANNFVKFTEVLSNKALLEFGNLGKLIKQGYIVLPEQPDRDTYGLDDDKDGLNKLDYLEDMKAYRQEIADLRRDKTKLYALILQHLSDESLEAVQKEAGWPAVEQDADPEALWQLVEVKHKVHSASEVEAVVKLATRTQLVTTRQGAFESIIAFKQRYTNALKANKAMDFFSKLDNARYVEFKTTYINNLQMKACNPPADLNEIFTLANTYLKPKIAAGNGLGSTFATAADHVDKKEKDRQKRRHNNQSEDAGGKQEMEKEGREADKKPVDKDADKKPVKCFNCEGDHYVNNCPELKEWQKAKESGNVVATWEGNTFAAYRVNSIGVKGLGATEVLLDNQADISIMLPELLRMLEPVKSPVKISGVGGVQLVAKESGYVQDFFRVYASNDTRANVLCFSDVEDMYEITYVQGQSFTVHLPERDIVFRRKDKLYVADFTTFGQAYASRVCTKAEEGRARQAHELLKISGYPSLQEAIHLVQDGNIAHLPMLMAVDIKRAYDMFGEPVGAVRGKMTKKRISRAIYDDDLVLDEKKQTLYNSDIMHVDGCHFLVTVCEPLQLIMQGAVERESASALGIAFTRPARAPTE
jgi:hypothetical protein